MVVNGSCGLAETERTKKSRVGTVKMVDFIFCDIMEERGNVSDFS